MADTYSIACVDCKERLWIAQKGASGRAIYSGNDAIMESLEEFLFNHIGHELVFNDDIFSEISEYSTESARKCTEGG